MIEYVHPAHRLVFREVVPGDDTLGRWEMHCSCGAWQHGTKEQVGRTAEMHQQEEGPKP